MPLPTPHPNERYQEFVSRFLKNEEAKRQYPEIKQRFAVMVKTWKSK